MDIHNPLVQQKIRQTGIRVLFVTVSYVAAWRPLSALAASQAFVSPLKQKDLACFLLAILNSLIYILFPIIVLMIVYTGFLFVTAQGNEAKISEARKALLWTVIGGLVVLGSVALALAIKATVDNFLTAPNAAIAC